MKWVKMKYKQKLQNLANKDSELARNIYIDNNKIEEILIIKYMFKIMKFVIIIVHISFIVGMGWMILMGTIEDFWFNIDYTEVYSSGQYISDPNRENYENTFVVYNKLHLMEPNDISTILTYFAFTTLSTVGFGDFVPRSDEERFVGAFIMLFGVMIFSTIMGGFIDLITEFKEYDKDLNDGYSLAKFFGVLKRFNGKVQINENLKKRIEDHFDY